MHSPLTPGNNAMANALHTNDPELLAIHRANMMASLAHRLDVAKKANNLQLIALLEQERQELIAESSPFKALRSLVSWFKTVGENLQKATAKRSGLEVSKVELNGDCWWYAFDPQTGRSVYADSDEELLLWVKTNYQGK